MTLAIGDQAKGVTLMELSVALAVLAVAVAVVWPRWTRITDRETDDAVHRKLIELQRRAILSHAE